MEEYENMKNVMTKKQQFSIRKYSVGVASVLIGSVLLGSHAVLAEEAAVDVVMTNVDDEVAKPLVSEVEVAEPTTVEEKPAEMPVDETEPATETLVTVGIEEPTSVVEAKPVEQPTSSTPRNTTEEATSSESATFNEFEADSEMLADSLQLTKKRLESALLIARKEYYSNSLTYASDQKVPELLERGDVIKYLIEQKLSNSNVALSEREERQLNGVNRLLEDLEKTIRVHPIRQKYSQLKAQASLNLDAANSIWTYDSYSNLKTAYTKAIEAESRVFEDLKYHKHERISPLSSDTMAKLSVDLDIALNQLVVDAERQKLTMKYRELKRLTTNTDYTSSSRESLRNELNSLHFTIEPLPERYTDYTNRLLEAEKLLVLVTNNEKERLRSELRQLQNYGGYIKNANITESSLTRLQEALAQAERDYWWGKDRLKEALQFLKESIANVEYLPNTTQFSDTIIKSFAVDKSVVDLAKDQYVKVKVEVQPNVPQGKLLLGTQLLSSVIDFEYKNQGKTSHRAYKQEGNVYTFAVPTSEFLYSGKYALELVYTSNSSRKSVSMLPYTLEMKNGYTERSNQPKIYGAELSHSTVSIGEKVVFQSKYKLQSEYNKELDYAVFDLYKVGESTPIKRILSDKKGGTVIAKDNHRNHLLELRVSEGSKRPTEIIQTLYSVLTIDDTFTEGEYELRLVSVGDVSLQEAPIENIEKLDRYIQRFTVVRANKPMVEGEKENLPEAKPNPSEQPSTPETENKPAEEVESIIPERVQLDDMMARADKEIAANALSYESEQKVSRLLVEAKALRATDDVTLLVQKTKELEAAIEVDDIRQNYEFLKKRAAQNIEFNPGWSYDTYMKLKATYDEVVALEQAVPEALTYTKVTPLGEEERVRTLSKDVMVNLSNKLDAAIKQLYLDPKRKELAWSYRSLLETTGKESSYTEESRTRVQRELKEAYFKTEPKPEAYEEYERKLEEISKLLIRISTSGFDSRVQSLKELKADAEELISVQNTQLDTKQLAELIEQANILLKQKRFGDKELFDNLTDTTYRLVTTSLKSLDDRAFREFRNLRSQLVSGLLNNASNLHRSVSHLQRTDFTDSDSFIKFQQALNQVELLLDEDSEIKYEERPHVKISDAVFAVFDSIGALDEQRKSSVEYIWVSLFNDVGALLNRIAFVPNTDDKASRISWLKDAVIRGDEVMLDEKRLYNSYPKALESAEETAKRMSWNVLLSEEVEDLTNNIRSVVEEYKRNMVLVKSVSSNDWSESVTLDRVKVDPNQDKFLTFTVELKSKLPKEALSVTVKQIEKDYWHYRDYQINDILRPLKQEGTKYIFVIPTDKLIYTGKYLINLSIDDNSKKIGGEYQFEVTRVYKKRIGSIRSIQNQRPIIVDTAFSTAINKRIVSQGEDISLSVAHNWQSYSNALFDIYKVGDYVPVKRIRADILGGRLRTELMIGGYYDYYDIEYNADMYSTFTIDDTFSEGEYEIRPADLTDATMNTMSTVEFDTLDRHIQRFKVVKAKPQPEVAESTTEANGMYTFADNDRSTDVTVNVRKETAQVKQLYALQVDEIKEEVPSLAGKNYRAFEVNFVDKEANVVKFADAYARIYIPVTQEVKAAYHIVKDEKFAVPFVMSEDKQGVWVNVEHLSTYAIEFATPQSTPTIKTYQVTRKLETTEVEYVEDHHMFIGETRIVPMVPGEATVEITETFENGALHSSVQHVVTNVLPKPAVVYYGTKLKEVPSTESTVTTKVDKAVSDKEQMVPSEEQVVPLVPSNEIGVPAVESKDNQPQATPDTNNDSEPAKENQQPSANSPVTPSISGENTAPTPESDKQSQLTESAQQTPPTAQGEGQATSASNTTPSIPSVVPNKSLVPNKMGAGDQPKAPTTVPNTPTAKAPAAPNATTEQTAVIPESASLSTAPVVTVTTQSTAEGEALPATGEDSITWFTVASMTLMAGVGLGMLKKQEEA